jgi:hypothetical protein
LLKVNDVDEKELKEFVEQLKKTDELPEKRRVNIANLSKLLSNMRDYRNLLVSSVGIIAFNMAHSANGSANQTIRCRIAFGFIVVAMA